MLRTPSNQRNEKKISLKVVTQPTDEFLGLEGEEIEEYKKSVENFNKTHNPNTDAAVRSLTHQGSNQSPRRL